MSATNDKSLGLTAVLFAPRDQVIDAVLKSVTTLGSHASAARASSKVTVKIYPGLVQKLSSVSPTVGVTLRPGPGEAVSLSARIEQYRTVQSRMFLIPVGPKRLVGKSTYKNFLDSLAQELRPLTGAEGSVKFVS